MPVPTAIVTRPVLVPMLITVSRNVLLVFMLVITASIAVAVGRVRVEAVVVGSTTKRPPRVCVTVRVAVDVAVCGAAWTSISNSFVLPSVN